MSIRTVQILTVTFILMLTIIASADTQRSFEETPRSWITDPGLRDLIQRTTDNITNNDILYTIQNLTAFGTRYDHSVQNPKVIKWIRDQFAALGYNVTLWNFTHQANDKLSNVIVEIPGTDPDGIVIVSAHMDSVVWPDSWSFPESSAPGADDDATGIAALISIGKVLKRYSFKQDIRLIAFDAEELIRAVGSTHYTENLTKNNENILGVLNVDMIGYNDRYIKLDVVYDVASHFLYTDYVVPVNKEFGFIDHLIDKEDPNSQLFWGDIDPFWDAGYHGISFVESLYPRGDEQYYSANPNFHTSNDTIDKVNIPLVTKGTKLVLGTLISIAEPILSDLVVDGVYVPGNMVFEDERTQVKTTIKNLGEKNATDVQITFSVDDKEEAWDNISVPASKSINYTFNWTAIPGEHFLSIDVDPYDLIGEWDEGNNNKSVDEFVQTRPDVELRRFDILEDSVAEDQVAHLTVKVLNHGPTDIECNLTILDNRTNSPFLTEFLQLDASEEWERIFEWSGNINGTHLLTGRLQDFNPYDRDGSNDVLTDPISVNGIPLAHMTINPMIGGLTFSPIGFFAKGSSDDVAIATYQFDFGDGNATDWISTDHVSHNYTDDGTYRVSLKVRDGPGAESPAFYRDVIIENRPPVIKVSVDRVLAETGSPITFYSDGSFDLDGTIVSYNWTFTPGPSYSTLKNPKMIFNRRENYNARLMIIDNDGAVSSTSLEVSITNRAPVASIDGLKKGSVGEIMVFSGSGSRDEDGFIHSYYWQFGDGTGSSKMNESHAFSRVGNYTVELKVVDNNGGMDVATLKVVITKEPVIKDGAFGGSGLTLLGAFLLMAIIYIVIDLASGPPHKGKENGKKGKRKVKKVRIGKRGSVQRRKATAEDKK